MNRDALYYLDLYPLQGLMKYEHLTAEHIGILHYIEEKLDDERYSDILMFAKFNADEIAFQQVVEYYTGKRQRMNSFEICYNSLIKYHIIEKYKRQEEK